MPALIFESDSVGSRVVNKRSCEFHSQSKPVEMRFKLSVLCLFFLAIAAPFSMADDVQELPIWPSVIPGENQLPKRFFNKLKVAEAKNTEDRKFGVTTPALSLYPADEQLACGTSILVCPGGGYNVLAWDHEGRAIAKWLNSLGIHAFVLKYRVPRRPKNHKTPPLQDAQRALRLIRGQKTGITVDPQRIGILGFSAGGNLAVNVSTQWTTSSYEFVDETDQVSSKPNFMIPIYAAYLGDPKNDLMLDRSLNLSQDTPPMFTVVTQDDKNRGLHAALLFAKLTELKVNAELHVFTKGGHGYGIRKSDHPVSGWPTACEAWLKSQGWLGKPAK